jgi:FAD/FMN-containing dehydrogenase
VGGEVMNSVPRTETAYVHRNVTTLLRPTTVWSDDTPSAGEDLNAWTDDVIATIAPATLEESYQNFPNRSIENWEQLYFAENYERLVDVKTQYDPTNLFNNPQSVRPR